MQPESGQWKHLVGKRVAHPTGYIRQPENGANAFSGCLIVKTVRQPEMGNARLKLLQNLQWMAHQQLADIFPISQALLNQAFGDEPSPRHFKFQAALGVLQRF